jgi:hypothetical protein
MTRIDGHLAFVLGVAILAGPACSVGPVGRTQNTRLFKQWNAKCKEAADLLETIKDVPTAKAAAPQLKAVLEELDKLSEKLEASYDPAAPEEADMPGTTKQVGEGIAQMQRLMLESVRVGKDPEIRAALGDAWQWLPAAAMMDAQGNFPATE